MLKIKTSIGEIRISPGFFVLAAIMLSIGCSSQFFVLIACVCLHELAHILIAASFGLSPSALELMPFGLAAELNELDSLPRPSRLAVLLAGPAVNFALWLAFDGMFAALNLSLFVINLLPVCPLDGGRILYEFLSRYGSLNAAAALRKIGMRVCLLLGVCGFVQVTLFPINLSLLCLSLYLRDNLKSEFINQSAGFYKLLFSGIKNKRTLKIMCYQASFDIKAELLFKMINPDDIKRFEVNINGTRRVIDEEDLLELFSRGLLGESLAAIFSAERDA